MWYYNYSIEIGSLQSLKYEVDMTPGFYNRMVATNCEVVTANCILSAYRINDRFCNYILVNNNIPEYGM